ncbi:hypothetical protein GCM10022224_082560 [Nonomuraea antimicrobica]|uniref:DUF4439 domain-containing protein n=1 Tax=Nonomuraea antimicrobica TaxID=561173 RepID=A0ABP7DE99_9ACTN
MRPRQLSRRALLAGGAAALTACSASGPPKPSVPPPDSPDTVLVKGLIVEKERTIALYSSLISGGAEKLVPFRNRHQAHLNELRKHVPPAATSAASATASASGSPSPSASARRTTVARLRDLERKAAAQRVRQLDTASPGLAQLIASIGACEAAHVVALPRSV